MSHVLGTTFRQVGQLGWSIPPQLAANINNTYQPTTQTYSPPSSGGTLKADNIFNSSVGLLSQALSAFGRRESTQITGSGSVQAIIQPQSQPSYGQAGLVQQQPIQQYAQAGGVGASAVNTATGFLDGIASSFGISTTTFMLLAAGGIYLLFKPAPSRR